MTSLPGRLTVLAGATLLAAVAAAPATASANTDPQTGVWWQLSPAPATQQVPDGGLWLQTSPAGDTASSAVRFVVDDSSVAVTLRLKIASSNSAPASKIVMCNTNGPWAAPATSPGPWADRPLPDCTARLVNGALGADGQSVDFALSGYAPGQAVDLVLTRDPADTQTVEDVTFEKPAAADLVTRPAQSTPAGTDGSSSVAGGGGPAATLDGRSSSTLSSSGSLSTPPHGGSAAFALGPAPATNFSAAVGGPAASAAPAVAGTAAPSNGPITTPAVVRPHLTRQDAHDAAWWTAFAAFAACALWMAAIVSRRLSGGRATTGTFTLYRGTPPQ